MSSLEQRILQDNSLKNIYNFMQRDVLKPVNSKEKYKHNYNKYLSQKRRFIDYRREKMNELYSKEEELYKKELREKNNFTAEERPNIQEIYKNNILKEDPKETILSNKHRFDNRKVISSKKNNTEMNYDNYAKELFSVSRNDDIFEIDNNHFNRFNIYAENYERELNKERNERLKIDDEIRKYHKQLEYLKQEEIVKRKRYQDNLLQQINEKIQHQLKNLNNKYTENIENHITFYNK